MYDQVSKFLEAMKVDPMRQTSKGLIIVDQHYGISNFSEFVSMEGDPSAFWTHANDSFFERVLLYDSIVDLPPTTILPKKRGDKTKNKVKNANLSPLNLGNAFANDSVGDDDVMFLGGQFTGNYLAYDNVDPAKVMRGKYVDYMEFLLNPYDIYLDYYMRGYSVPANFWRQLVPHLCMHGIHSMEQPNQVGWLSGEEDRGHQLAMMNLTHKFNDAGTTKDELRQAYEECRDIPLKQCALIEIILKIESKLDYEMNNALLWKASKMEKQIKDKTSWR
nr:hypothetical protein [Tanacetum cinerariifolium]